MNKMKNAYTLFELPIQTATLVPSTAQTSRKISNAQFNKRINQTRIFLSKTFGGFTGVKATGGYTTKRGKLVYENIALITAFSERSSFIKNKNLWFKWMAKKRREWGQESLGFIIENDMFYLS